MLPPLNDIIASFSLPLLDFCSCYLFFKDGHDYLEYVRGKSHLTILVITDNNCRRQAKFKYFIWYMGTHMCLCLQCIKPAINIKACHLHQFVKSMLMISGKEFRVFFSLLPNSYVDN